MLRLGRRFGSRGAEDSRLRAGGAEQQQRCRGSAASGRSWVAAVGVEDGGSSSDGGRADDWATGMSRWCGTRPTQVNRGRRAPSAAAVPLGEAWSNVRGVTRKAGGCCCVDRRQRLASGVVAAGRSGAAVANAGVADRRRGNVAVAEAEPAGGEQKRAERVEEDDEQ